MRYFRSILVCACALANPPGANAVLTLEYWSGVQDFTPFNPASPSSLNPATLQGLRNWDFAGQQKLSSLTLQAGQKYIVKIVLRDRDNVGDGSGYTFSGNGTFNNSLGFSQFAFRFNYVPGVLNATRDQVANDGNALTASVWAGNAPGFSATQENIAFAVQDFGPSYFALGNLSFNPINMNGAAPFQQGNGDVVYPLANVVLHANSAGTGVLSLSQPGTIPPSFGTVYDPPGPVGNTIVSYDNAIWGTSGTLASLAFQITPVPEPASLLMTGLVITGLYYRKHRQARCSTA